MFQVKRESLNAVLDIIGMVPERIGLPSSEYIRVKGKGNKITMSVASYISGEVTLRGEGDWPFNKNFYLDRRTFVPWVTVARETKDKHRFQFYKANLKGKDALFVNHGSRKVHFSGTRKISGYGDLSRIRGDKHSIPISNDLKELLRCGSSCAVADTIQPHLNCVYTTGKRNGVISYAASDYVFYKGEGNIGEGEILTVPFPLFLINLLEVDGLKKVTCIGKYIMLRFKHGVVWQPISEEANKKFPIGRIKKYAKQAEDIPITFTTSARRFSRLIVRLGYYLQSVKRRDWVVTITGSKGDDVIHLRTQIPGVNFKEKISTSSSLKTNFKIEWPLATLAPIFEFISKRTRTLPLVVRINHSKKISYVQAGGYWLAVPSRQE